MVQTIAINTVQEALKNVMQLRRHLAQIFLERDDLIISTLISLVAGQHVLVVGPPGTAKSAVFMELAKGIREMNYFQWLLTKYTTPEEIFGPLSLKDLEKGVYKRNVANKLPTANIAFLDELFKANSAILNALLTAVNERIYYNNGAPSTIPLLSLFGASNEYPEEDENLGALFDRFLIRLEVGYIGEDATFAAMLKSPSPMSPAPVLSLEEIFILQKASQQVTISDDIIEALVNIRKDLMDRGIRPSDRRFRSSLSLLQARAILNSREEVKQGDLDILKHVLWENRDQKKTVAEILVKYASDPVETELMQYVEAATELYNETLKNKDSDTEQVIETNKKFKSMIKRLKELEAKYPSRQMEIKQSLDRLSQMNSEILAECLGIE
jgi:MoxR-like ATPase